MLLRMQPRENVTCPNRIGSVVHPSGETEISNSSLFLRSPQGLPAAIVLGRLHIHPAIDNRSPNVGCVLYTASMNSPILFLASSMSR